MITTINELKKTINENNNTKTTSMTIEELLKWYTGEDIISNEINDILLDNFFILKNDELIDFTEDDITNLINNKNMTVNINTNNVGNVIDNEFILNDIKITFNSMYYPGEYN